MKRTQVEAARLVEGGAGAIRLKVTGDCMRPALRDGDSVTLVRRWPWPGDIVGVRAHRGILVHRFLGWRPARFGRQWSLVTKADDRNQADAAVVRTDFLGVVESYRPGLRCRARACWSWVRLATRVLMHSPRRSS